MYIVNCVTNVWNFWIRLSSISAENWSYCKQALSLFLKTPSHLSFSRAVPHKARKTLWQFRLSVRPCVTLVDSIKSCKHITKLLLYKSHTILWFFSSAVTKGQRWADWASRRTSPVVVHQPWLKAFILCHVPKKLGTWLRSYGADFEYLAGVYCRLKAT